MPVSKADTAFRLPKISLLDFKRVEMDRVLTALFARIKHKGYPSRLRRDVKGDLELEAFMVELEKHIHGFKEHPQAAEAWVETHLMDVVNRGKHNQAIASPRPLHGFTYRFRNARHSREYGTAQQVYEMLNAAARGPEALAALEDFFFRGVDGATGKLRVDATIDLETQAILHLSDQVQSDAPDTRNREPARPLLPDAADLLAEDVLRLLTYDHVIPRTVMVEHLKIVLALHLALYHLRLLKLLPALLRGDTHGARSIGLLLDVEGDPSTEAARLAERSADAHFRRIPHFVHAYIAVKKLDEFAEYLVRRGRVPKPVPPDDFSVKELLTLRDNPDLATERTRFFGGRLDSLVEPEADSDPDPALQELASLDLDEFTAYTDAVAMVRGRFHRRYVVDALDALLLKNRPGSLITQPRARNAQRRFIFDSRALEVLLQIAVLKPGGSRGFHTEEVRIEQLLETLRERYGLYIDQLPEGDGFGAPSVSDRQALRRNADAFKGRLREVGFYRDLSDAYVTQTVSPRFPVPA